MADTILKSIGLIPTTDETGQAPAATPALFNTPFVRTQENFDKLEPIVRDVVAARGSSASLAEKLTEVDSAIGTLKTSDAVAVSNAVKLAWTRSDEGYAVEEFSPNMTLITFDSIAVTRTVKGDDSIDVESTSTLKVGNTYVLSYSGGQQSVTVAEIFDSNRFRATESMNMTLSEGTLGQTDWNIFSGHAIAPAGGIYYSSAMSVLRYYGDGRLDIRRDNGDGKLDVQVRASGGEWQAAKLLETVEEVVGTRNEFYQLPVGGIVELKIQADAKTRVEYLMVYTSPEAGRAYPVAQPTNLTPAQGAVSVVGPVTFTGTAPRSLYGIKIVSATIRIATDKNMQNIIHTGTIQNPSGKLSYTVSADIVETDKNYFWDFFYTDEDDNTSPFSDATGFSTADIFNYVVPPQIISPANEAEDVMAPVTVRLSDFAVFGAEDTLAASCVVASYNADMSDPFFDSVEVLPGEDIVITESAGLIVSKDLYLQPLHKGSKLGWSAAGPVCYVKLADAFQLNYWGDGSDGDVVITDDTVIHNELNGDMVVKNYKNLTITEGATLSVENPCRGLLIYVDGDCEINGKLSFDNMGLCAFDPTSTPATDGVPMSKDGLVFVKAMDGGTATGTSNLSGCGLAAVNAENEQSVVTAGYKLVLTPTCCGTGGAGATGHGGQFAENAGMEYGGSGGAGGAGNYAGGSGGGGGGGGSDFAGGGGGGGGGAGIGGAGGTGTTLSAALYAGRGAAGGNRGTGGAGGGSATRGGSAGCSGSNGAAGLLILAVRGKVFGSGIISSSTTGAGGAGGAGSFNNYSGGAGSGGGGAGGGCIVILHSKALDSSLTIITDGGAGGAGGAGRWSGAAGAGGAAGLIVTQLIDK